MFVIITPGLLCQLPVTIPALFILHPLCKGYCCKGLGLFECNASSTQALCTRPLSIPKWTLKTYGGGQVGNSPGKLTMPIKCAIEDCMKRALFMRCELVSLDTLCTNVSLSIHK